MTNASAAKERALSMKNREINRKTKDDHDCNFFDIEAQTLNLTTPFSNKFSTPTFSLIRYHRLLNFLAIANIQNLKFKKKREEELLFRL